MKLIVGLGNPGKKFAGNRHTVGYMFVDFARRGVKTNVFMNDSGDFVKKLLTANRYLLTALYVAHDDLDLPLGKYKIQFGVGPKVHNGINSVEEALGTGDFWRIRIGIDNRNNQDTRYKIQGEKYVLQDFTKEELEILEGVFDAIVKDHSFPS